jgi:hypothetical protein
MRGITFSGLRVGQTALSQFMLCQPMTALISSGAPSSLTVVPAFAIFTYSCRQFFIRMRILDYDGGLQGHSRAVS